MATRNLTRLYTSCRDSAVKNSPHKLEYKVRSSKKNQADDTVALVSDEDLELGRSSVQNIGITTLPPEWTDAVEEVQYDISKIQLRIKELNVLHNKHLNQPSMDDDMSEEHTIDVTTQEITQMFHQCQRCIQSIQSRSRSTNKSEQIILRNVVSTLASQLQELSIAFKKGQSTYLKKMKNREEREREYFSNDFQPTNAFMKEEDESFDDLYDKGFTTAQLQMVEDNEAVVSKREDEIQHILRSIGDLNAVFKDLAILIIDQGTILDRIDYNVEQASVTVEKGLQQLQKSEKHQKSNRKMICILVLSVILVIMIVALVLTKSS